MLEILEELRIGNLSAEDLKSLETQKKVSNIRKWKKKYFSQIQRTIRIAKIRRDIPHLSLTCKNLLMQKLRPLS